MQFTARADELPQWPSQRDLLKGKGAGSFVKRL